MTHEAQRDVEPDAGTLSAAMLATARLWLGGALLNPVALESVANALLDDARAATELHTAGDWLLASADRLPPAFARLLQLLSTSQTLDHVH